ncbi:gliding motility lipoprotein GldB [Pedobacter sp. SL55]|uniref:gliding motility lipoprotein GldB n=1 Tax=Pedobacter sp. SL55 TaxID=2995161 RepID=UPI00226E212F|nr:gliding motility lipoprotein GldB [Pedobacter sp. SL55]WAC41373.1 gliding motility lipoprotein GldB [Pedobacter sp. SL55]
MILNSKFSQSYLFFLCAVLFFSCSDSKKPDVSNIKLDIKIERFDKDLYQGKAKSIELTDSLLHQKYGAFYEDFIFKMVGNDSYTSQEVLQGLYNDKAYTDLNHEVDSVFPNLTQVENELTQSFKYIKYYYPKVQIPRFIGFLSGFSYQTPIGDNYVGIGLDMFLGKDSKFYGALVNSIPLYLSRKFTPAYIVPRVSEYYIRENLFKERDEDRSLLAKMIYNGKILYFMDQIMPDNMPDSVKIGYTDKQLDWCKAFEAEIWGFYLESNLLYETDYPKIQVYLSEGPFTPGLGENRQSPPKLGVWTGWQIVRKYMEENPEVTLQQLMADTDTQKLLTKSKYKPKLMR